MAAGGGSRAPSGENVDDDIGGMDALGQGLSAGGLDGGQTAIEHGGENLDYLPVAIVAAGESCALCAQDWPAAPNP
jgi:hypothetical protein